MRLTWLTLICSLFITLSVSELRSQTVDDGVIRFEEPSESEVELQPNFQDTPGFDQHAFESRMESLWFQRKAYLTEGLEEDAARASASLLTFCREEGLARVTDLSGALLIEAEQFRQNGRHRWALNSIALAEDLDPGRSQTAFLKAKILWGSGAGIVKTIGTWLRGFSRAAFEIVDDLRSLNRIFLILLLGVVLVVMAFAGLMVWRHQAAIRHEAEEFLMLRSFSVVNAKLGGWIWILFPLVSVFFAGWIIFFWIAVASRFMWRKERIVVLALLLMSTMLVPAYKMVTSGYGIAADKRVRTTWSAAEGEYDPQRIRDLLTLIEESPDDATLVFLLADTYRAGRHYEQAFDTYQTVLEMDPSLWQAHINLGNIYHHLAQHVEAVGEYQKSIDLNPENVIALYNMHVVQAAMFQFKESRSSLSQARAADPDWVTAEAALRETPDRSPVAYAPLDRADVWETALGGDQEAEVVDPFQLAGIGYSFLNLYSILSALTFCVVLYLSRPSNRPTAKKCIRCKRAFCHRCRRIKESAEYCSQCYHLFIAGDGLAPETKTKKLYEIEKAERGERRTRRLIAFILPGSHQILRGAPWLGSLQLGLWMMGLVALSSYWWKPIQAITGQPYPVTPLIFTNVPSLFSFSPWSLFASVFLIFVWLSANSRSLLRRRGAYGS